MTKCDFCEYSKPTGNGKWRCGHTPLDPEFRSTACERALDKMCKVLKKEDK